MIVAVSGARKIPQSIRRYLIARGRELQLQGATMTNGGATGADSAFAEGFICAPGTAPLELYLPWRSFNYSAPGRNCCRDLYTVDDDALPEHFELAERCHPAWSKLSQTVKSFMVRNAMLVRRFDRPVDLLIACPDCSKLGWGGTGHTMRVAYALGIPVVMVQDTGKELPWNP